MPVYNVSAIGTTFSISDFADAENPFLECYGEWNGITGRQNELIFSIIPGSSTDVRLHDFFEKALKREHRGTCTLTINQPNGRKYSILAYPGVFSRVPTSLQSGRFADSKYTFEIHSVRYE